MAVTLLSVLVGLHTQFAVSVDLYIARNTLRKHTVAFPVTPYVQIRNVLFTFILISCQNDAQEFPHVLTAAVHKLELNSYQGLKVLANFIILS
jgi:hypothetical protein